MNEVEDDEEYNDEEDEENTTSYESNYSFKTATV